MLSYTPISTLITGSEPVSVAEKDTTKLNILSENNKEQIEKLTETAIKNADASEESADLIAKVVANASDELVNACRVDSNPSEESQCH